MFSKLIVVSQTRDFDLKKLFEYELSNVPLALFNPDGSMSKCTKSELLNEIEGSLSVEEPDDIDGLSALIIDFMVLLRMVCTDTTKRKSFGELSDTILNMIFSSFPNLYGGFNQVCRKSEEGNDSHARNSVCKYAIA